MDVTANKKSYIIHRSMGYGNLWLLGAELLGINVWEHQERLVSLKKCMILQVVVFLGKIRVLI